MNQKQLFTKLDEIEQEIYRLNNIISVMYVDLQSVCPESGKSERSEGLSYLTGLVHEKVTSEEFIRVVQELMNHPDF